MPPATLEQILDAVRHLPESQRAKLLQEIGALPYAEEALVAAQRLRGKYRMSKQKRERMAKLLAKGNAGMQTPAEKAAADELVAEFEQKTLELARALTRTVGKRRPTGSTP